MSESLEGRERISFRCLQVWQPIGFFYVGVMSADDLVDISWADIRRLQERDLDEYLGIQRTLNDARVRELADYVRTVDATFPTSIIVAVESKYAEFDELKAVMTLPRVDSIAKIIDGQHRIAGLKTMRGTRFEVNVTIFVDMDIADQANVFSTINLAQTKVSKSLVYDLFTYAKARSPQKTCHHIARLLNRREGSPFFGRIKVLGQATPGRKETLTQAAVVERLLPYISDQPLKDLDALKRGKELPETPPQRRIELIFREMFRKEQDQDIALVVWNFFVAVRDRWPQAWTTIERGYVLNRTTGFAALMRLLRPAYNAFAQEESVPPVDHFAAIFARITLRDSDFTPDVFKPGSAGEAELARRLLEESAL